MVNVALFLTLLPAQAARDNIDFWKDPPRAQAAAAAELVLAGDVWKAWILRDLGRRYSVWGNELVIARDQAPPLAEEWLNLVEDRKAVPDFRGRAPDEIKDYEFAFQRVYAEALAYSFLVSPDAFALKSKEYPHVTFAHLYNDPAKYRGQVIRVEGTLARVRQADAPLAAQRLGAYKVLYEGWIFGKTRNAPPFWVIFPIKPDDVPVAESVKRNVAFDGYFISLIRYRAAGKDLYAPLLIGPTVTPKEPARAAETPVPISMPLLLGVVGFVGVVALTLLILGIVFRRGDQQVRGHLRNIEAARSVEILGADGASPHVEANGSTPTNGLPRSAESSGDDSNSK